MTLPRESTSAEARLKPSARPVLHRLRLGPATTHDLCQPEVGGVRFGARLLEMREVGFVVHAERLKAPARGSLYTLVSEPEVEQALGGERESDGDPAVGANTARNRAAGQHSRDIGEHRPSLAPAEPPAALFDADALVRPLGAYDGEAA